MEKLPASAPCSPLDGLFHIHVKPEFIEKLQFLYVKVCQFIHTVDDDPTDFSVFVIQNCDSYRIFILLELAIDFGFSLPFPSFVFIISQVHKSGEDFIPSLLSHPLWNHHILAACEDCHPPSAGIFNFKAIGD